MIVRAALTETRNVFMDMPTDPAKVSELAGRSDDIRAANVAHHVALIEAAAERGAGIVGLGELFPGPYFALGRDPVWFELAEDALEGPTVAALRDVARKREVILIAPIYELDRVSGKRFNTAVVIDERGVVLGKYRKTHIPGGENETAAFCETYYYERSDGELGNAAGNVSKNPFFPVFETSRGRIGVATCYDRHFEGVMRSLAHEGAQIVFSPAVTFGEKSRRMWQLEFEVDAARHNLFIGGSNRRGAEPPWNVEFFGESHFAGPSGRVEPVTGDHTELVLCDLDLAQLEGTDPSGWKLGTDTRPDIYSD